MPVNNSAELIKKIRSGDLFNVYYIYGKDILTVETITKAIIKKYLGKLWNENYTKLDGTNIDIGNLVDMMEICPMFSDYNVILINDLNCEELQSEKMKQLEKAIEEIPDFTVLIMNVTGFDVYGGKRKITGKNKKIMDLISKRGIVCECEFKTMPVMVKTITEKVKKNGCEISSKNAQKLAEYCLMDSIQIINEIEKLCSYKENAEITAEDIEALVSGKIETDSFKLAKAVISMNSGLAFYLLNDLLDKRNDPVAVLSAISSSFIDLYRARAAMTVDKRQNDIISDFNYKGREFAVNNAYRDCRKISLENIRECICILRNSDKKLKQSTSSKKIILEKTLTEMLVTARR